MDKESKRLSVVVILKEQLKLPEGSRIRKLEIIKDAGRYYGIFCIEKTGREIKHGASRWMTLDMDHKNLMVGVDQDGNTIEFENLSQIKYWDRKIDELKSKRDKCKRKSVFINTGVRISNLRKAEL